MTARIPSTLCGAAGCLGLYVIGALVLDRKTAWFAFLLLLINPLYGLLARRAMSDIPCESMVIGSVAFGLIAWRRFLEGQTRSISAWLSMTFAGLFAGFAILCKFSGMLALMTLAVWCVLGVILRNRGIAGRGAYCVGYAIAAFLAMGTFVMLNPFMTAHPPAESLSRDQAELDRMNLWQRFQFQLKLRTEVAEGQRKRFVHNALESPLEKIKVVAVQGFGRFGPFGKRGWSSEEKTSERRYDWEQDWGALIWGPLVVAGFLAACLRGLRQFRSNEVPTCWAIAAWAIVAFGVVTAYIPLAWDRYLLPIQSVSCILVASLFSICWDAMRNRTGRDRELGVIEA
jgi:4-amino-4-deoxy-L-arabinose transferase-like glycosyltransferase